MDPEMTNTQKLLDKARLTCKPQSWYRLSQVLEIDPATISRCNRRHGTLDNAAVIKLSKLLGEPLDQILPLVELDRAKTEKQRSFWERYAPRVLPSVAIAAALAVGHSGRVEAATCHRAHISSLTELYLMRSWFRFVDRFKKRIQCQLQTLAQAAQSFG